MIDCPEEESRTLSAVEQTLFMFSGMSGDEQGDLRPAAGVAMSVGLALILWFAVGFVVWIV